VQSPQILPNLPQHRIPELPDTDNWTLMLSDGRVEVTLDRASIRGLPHADLVDSFTCLEGWSTAPLSWRGVTLRDLFNFLPSMAAGPYLAISVPDTCTVISVRDLTASALLADALDGADLPTEHGGPYRLVVPGGVCFESVKWVQRIERCDSDQRPGARRRSGLSNAQLT
jgi:DMSO/TMAO reductase YedYZ molybdopterin-dependent catalytic subunit